jgi:ABC-type branched-subunit amino acid transport system ATPase component
VLEPVLRIERLSKHFGGLAALSQVSLELDRSGVSALIFPNDAGETPGELRPGAVQQACLRAEDAI